MEVMKMKPHEWASYPGDLVMASTFDAAITAKNAELAEYAENLADTTHDLQDRVKELAERDAEIAKLNARYERRCEQFESAASALRTRAEAAEAKCAELEKELKWSSDASRLAILARYDEAKSAEAKTAELERDLEREQAAHENTINHRDNHENAINDICNALGLDEEGCKWSSHSYPPRNAIERIEELFTQLAAANERVAALEKERDGLRKALSYLHERLTEYKNGEAMIYADARGDIAVIEKALAQPSAEVGE